jgi:hypothetical protein
MTSYAESPATFQPQTAAEAAPLTRSLRRVFLIAAPILAGLLALAGTIADPATGESGRTMWAAYAANPDALQWKSFFFHWSYAFWGMAAFLLALSIRGRGKWLAYAAAVVAFVGVTTLPGLLVVDFYDSAIGQVGGVALTAQVDAQMQGMWGGKAIAVPGVFSFLIALPLAALAAWRAGVVRWWAAVAAIAGVAVFMGSMVAVWGTIVTTLAFGLFALGLARGGRERLS